MKRILVGTEFEVLGKTGSLLQVRYIGRHTENMGEGFSYYLYKITINDKVYVINYDRLKQLYDLRV